MQERVESVASGQATATRMCSLLLGALALVASLSACGQRGPLTLPKPPPTSAPASSPAPSP